MILATPNSFLQSNASTASTARGGNRVTRRGERGHLLCSWSCQGLGWRNHGSRTFPRNCRHFGIWQCYVSFHSSYTSIEPGNICVLKEILAPFLHHLQEALPEWGQLLRRGGQLLVGNHLATAAQRHRMLRMGPLKCPVTTLWILEPSLGLSIQRRLCSRTAGSVVKAARRTDRFPEGSPRTSHSTDRDLTVTWGTKRRAWSSPQMTPSTFPASNGLDQRWTRLLWSQPARIECIQSEPAAACAVDPSAGYAAVRGRILCGMHLLTGCWTVQIFASVAISSFTCCTPIHQTKILEPICSNACYVKTKNGMKIVSHFSLKFDFISLWGVSKKHFSCPLRLCYTTTRPFCGRATASSKEEWWFL